MSSFFDVNGPIMNALRKLSCIFLCNVIFCLLCVPLFTIGAALSALYTCMFAVINDDEDDVIIKQFWDAFKSNFKQGTAIWLFCLVVFAFLSLFYMIISNFSGVLRVTYKIGFFFLSFIFLMGFQYFFPMQAHYANKVKNTIRNSWLMSIVALPWTLLSILLVVAAVYITLFMNPEGFQMAIFIWGTLGFGIVTYLNGFFFQKAFQIIDPQKQKFSQGPAEGAIFIDEEHRTSQLPEVSSGYSHPYWNQRPMGNVTQKSDDEKK